jgi:hypothetical protein
VSAAGSVAVGSWANVQRHAARFARAAEVANLLTEFEAGIDVLTTESEWTVFVSQVESALVHKEQN